MEADNGGVGAFIMGFLSTDLERLADSEAGHRELLLFTGSWSKLGCEPVFGFPHDKEHCVIFPPRKMKLNSSSFDPAGFKRKRKINQKRTRD